MAQQSLKYKKRFFSFFLVLILFFIVLLTASFVFAAMGEGDKKDFDPATASPTDSKEWPAYDSIKNPSVFTDFLINKASSGAVNNYLTANKNAIENSGDFGKQLMDSFPNGAGSPNPLAGFWTTKGISDESKKSILTSLDKVDAKTRGDYYTKLWSSLKTSDGAERSKLTNLLNDPKLADVRNNFFSAVFSEDAKGLSEKHPGVKVSIAASAKLEYKDGEVSIKDGPKLTINKWLTEISVGEKGNINAVYSNQGYDNPLKRTIIFSNSDLSLLDKDGKNKLGVDMLYGAGGAIMITHKEGIEIYSFAKSSPTDQPAVFVNGAIYSGTTGGLIGVDSKGKVIGGQGAIDVWTGVKYNGADSRKADSWVYFGFKEGFKSGFTSDIGDLVTKTDKGYQAKSPGIYFKENPDHTFQVTSIGINNFELRPVGSQVSQLTAVAGNNINLIDDTGKSFGAINKESQTGILGLRNSQAIDVKDTSGQVRYKAYIEYTAGGKSAMLFPTSEGVTKVLGQDMQKYLESANTPSQDSPVEGADSNCPAGGCSTCPSAGSCNSRVSYGRRGCSDGSCGD